MSLFPFSEYWWFYSAFTAVVLLLIAFDLGVIHKKAHVVGFREATVWSLVWITLALAFNYGLYRYALWRFPTLERFASTPGFDPQAAARQVGLEFLTGYLVEKALSVDNVFVFAVVFSFFGVPAIYQHRVLFYGILGALVFRAVFISLGAVLMKFHLVVLGFGILLILTGLKMAFWPEKPPEPDRNPVIRLFRKYVPVSPQLHGQRFFVRLNGRRHATPLFLCLLFLETTDIIFAFDSVPAIFALTREPMIVFTSNVCAILGLRALYFMLAGAMRRFHLLKYGLAVILVFIGLKMAWLNEAFGGKFPISWSLGFIGVVLAISTALSLLIPPKQALEPEAAEAEPARQSPPPG